MKLWFGPGLQRVWLRKGPNDQLSEQCWRSVLEFWDPRVNGQDQQWNQEIEPLRHQLRGQAGKWGPHEAHGTAGVAICLAVSKLRP